MMARIVSGSNPNDSIKWMRVAIDRVKNCGEIIAIYAMNAMLHRQFECIT